MFSFVFVLEGSEENVLRCSLIICTYIVWIYKGYLMHLLWMHDNLWSRRHWNLNCLLSREQLLLCNCHCFPFLKNMKWLSFICFFSFIFLCSLKMFHVFMSYSIFVSTYFCPFLVHVSCNLWCHYFFIWLFFNFFDTFSWNVSV